MSAEIAATICFILAVLHTFGAVFLKKLALRLKPGLLGQRLCHALGEVELAFALWAVVYLLALTLTQGLAQCLDYLKTVSFVEAAFVFAVMLFSASGPILKLANLCLETLARALPLPPALGFYFVAMAIGPCLGSLITEPAAMTVIALILRERFFNDQSKLSSRFKYASLGLLFVNISIGGTLTPFAAPAVLMVARTWQWGAGFMLIHFGYKAILACVLSTALVVAIFRNELLSVKLSPSGSGKRRQWSDGVAVLALGLMVLAAHNFLALLILFILFLAFSRKVNPQAPLKLRESALVALFLAGIAILVPPQHWWLAPLLASLNTLPLFLGAMGLTSVVDNAAITFLGAQVPNFSEASRYALAAGAIVGGGLTVIANAPNPAAYAILNSAFGDEGIRPLKLLLAALGPTLVAALCFWLL